MLFTQATGAVEPGHRSLDEPPRGEDDKAPLACWRCRDVHRDANVRRDPRGDRFVGALGPRLLETRPQGRHRQEEQLGPFGVDEGGDSHHDLPPQAEGIAQQMAFAAFDLLVAVNPVIPADFGRFDALGVNNDATGGGFALELQVHPLTEPLVEAFPRAVMCPFVEPVAHAARRWVALRQGAPLTTGAHQREDGAHHHLQIKFDRPPRSTAFTHHQRLQQPPLGVCQLARLAATARVSLVAGARVSAGYSASGWLVGGHGLSSWSSPPGRSAGLQRW